jgi:molybdate transport system permease protein
MLTAADITALLLTIKLAAVSTVILLIIGLPLAWWLARTNRRIKSVIEVIIAMPLILPPTVIGFYLLLAFAPDKILAQTWLRVFDSSLAFSFSGLVIGSVIYSLPFVVQPMQSSYERIPELILKTAASLGAGFWDRYFSVLLPMTRRATLAAATLAFAHTMGEFGIVLMIGGNIPAETQVVSIALFDHVESMAYQQAHGLALTLLVFSFASLLLINLLSGKNKPRVRHA